MSSEMAYCISICILIAKNSVWQIIGAKKYLNLEL